MPERPVCRLVTQAALVLLCGVAAATDDPKQPDPGADADLLEFLGSVDSGADSPTTADDGAWIDYLAQTDIGKVAKKADPKDAAEKPPSTDEPPPAPEEKKDE